MNLTFRGIELQSEDAGHLYLPEDFQITMHGLKGLVDNHRAKYGQMPTYIICSPEQRNYYDSLLIKGPDYLEF